MSILFVSVAILHKPHLAQHAGTIHPDQPHGTRKGYSRRGCCSKGVSHIPCAGQRLTGGGVGQPHGRQREGSGMPLLCWHGEAGAGLTRNGASRMISEGCISGSLSLV